MVTANKKTHTISPDGSSALFKCNNQEADMRLIFHVLKAKSDPEVVLKEIHILILLI